MPKATRRTFLKAATVTSAGFLVAAGNTKVFSNSPNERPGVACVGVGGKGSSDADNAARFGKVIAICDVDKGTLTSKGQGAAYKDAKQYVDFREMLKNHEKEVEIVTVSTPDHMHAAPTLMAMRMGMSCYTQKPLTRTIYEARLLRKVAEETGVCHQMGNQGSALNSSRWAIAQLRAGVLGPLKEVYVWCNRPVWPQGLNADGSGRRESLEIFAEKAKAERPDEADKLIDGQKKIIENQLKNLDWDLWLGTAPERPFWPGIYHTFKWRGWWDFGSGALGDMACHQVTVPFDGCGLRNPVSVKAKTDGHDFDIFPLSTIIEFQFPETAENPALKFWWYDRNGNRPPMEVFEPWGIEPKSSGVLIIGEKGAFYSADDYCGTAEFKKCEPLPDDQIDPGYAEDKGGMDATNMFELFSAVDAKDPKICRSNFIDRGCPLTETILLGNLAVWAAHKGGGNGTMMADWGPTIEWDAENLIVKNLDDIKKSEGAELGDKILSLVKPTYRDGYRLD